MRLYLVQAIETLSDYDLKLDCISTRPDNGDYASLQLFRNMMLVVPGRLSRSAFESSASRNWCTLSWQRSGERTSCSFSIAMIKDTVDML